MSYVIPYALVGGTIGGTLSYASENPVFLIAGTLLGVAGGMIRNNNVKNKCDSTGHGNNAVKAVGLYVLGPYILAGACALGLFLCIKR
jgi:F0F1-type ATP synthase assembly protein I